MREVSDERLDSMVGLLSEHRKHPDVSLNEHPTQKLRMMFEAILEPVLVRAESAQDAGRAAVTSDQDGHCGSRETYGEAAWVGDVLALRSPPQRLCLPVGQLNLRPNHVSMMAEVLRHGATQERNSQRSQIGFRSTVPAHLGQGIVLLTGRLLMSRRD